MRHLIHYTSHHTIPYIIIPASFYLCRMDSFEKWYPWQRWP